MLYTEYNSDGKAYCVTTSSIRAKTNYYSTSSTSAIQTGTYPNHIGYTGGAGSFNSTSIFGSSSPTGNYAVYSDGGGDIWVGNRFYTFKDNGVRVVGARVWEPASASQAFLSSPLSFRIYTQDWTGSTLGGCGSSVRG